jgi:diguanylate cyclase (GGDEF)-like protein/PAS domain S-box-containing protein
MQIKNSIVDDSFPWYKSLRFRLTITVIITSLFMGIAMLVALYMIYNDRIEGEFSDKIRSLSIITAEIVDGETIDHYLETLEKDEEFYRILGLLRLMQRETGIAYISVSRFTDDGELFVFDTDESEDGHMGLGDYEPYSDDMIESGILALYFKGERIPPFSERTVWGYLFSASEPILRADGSVAGFACVSIYMDDIFRERLIVMTTLGVIVLVLLFISVAANLFIIQKFVIAPVRILVDGVSSYRPGAELPGLFEQTKTESRIRSEDELGVLETAIIGMESRIADAEELTKLMLDASPLCSELWDESRNIIDCNEAAIKLYGFKDKEEYIEKYLSLCTPELQPCGQNSDFMFHSLLDKAFEEGYCHFHWMQKYPSDGSPIPTEVSLVRVGYKNESLIVAYTRDLREIKRLESEAEKIFYDALTGIYNRRFFDENLKRAIKSLSRSESPLSLMMIDIDFFKKYNDGYGHDEGDTCLITVAETLSNCATRGDDFVARYGGEEFAVVMPNTNKEGATVVAEKLIDAIRSSKIKHEYSDIADHITVSIGIATGPVKHGHTGLDFMKPADEMLYKSKQDGRNRYTIIEM